MADSGIVVFNINKFRENYPQFVNVSDNMLENFFLVACQFCDNTTNSLVTNLAERSILLDLLVCHIATLHQRGSMVGILQSATQGKVSTSFAVPINLNWYQQTQCGYIYWQMTLKYRVGGRYYGYDHQ